MDVGREWPFMLAKPSSEAREVLGMELLVRVQYSSFQDSISLNRTRVCMQA